MENNTHNIVTKGFSRVFDRLNKDDVSLLLEFIHDFHKSVPKKGQNMVNESLLQAQNLNQIEAHPELLKANIIHRTHLNYISDDEKVKVNVNLSHQLVGKYGQMYTSKYVKLKDEFHKEMYMNKALPKQIREQHYAVAKGMEFATK